MWVALLFAFELLHGVTPYLLMRGESRRAITYSHLIGLIVAIFLKSQEAESMNTMNIKSRALLAVALMDGRHIRPS